jgi:hypothetical protein
MSKPASTDLKELIDLLTPSEIRHFKKYASRVCDNNIKYVELFDAVRNCTTYDEYTIMQQTGIRNKQRFAEQKIYLYNTLLASLSEHHQQKRVDFQVREMINQAIILMNKNLFSQAQQIVKKAISLSVQHDITFYINELRILEAGIQLETCDECDMPEFYHQLFEKSQEQQQKVAFFIQLLEVRYSLTAIYNKYGSLSNILASPTIEHCKKLIQSVRVEQLTSLERIIHYANILSLHCILRNEEKQISLLRERRSIYENNPSRIQQYPLHYLCMLYKGISQLLVVGYEQEAKEWLNHFQTLLAINPNFQEGYSSRFIKHSSTYFELVFHTKTGNADKALMLIKETNSAFEQDVAYLSPRISVRHLYLNTVICVFNGAYTEALDWCNKLMAMESIRFDLQLLGRIYEIICHYEMGNYTLIEHRLLSLDRFSKKNIPCIKQTKHFIRLMRLLIKCPCSNSKSEILLQYIDDAGKIVTRERLDIFGFDFMIWVLHKAHRIGYAEAIKTYSNMLLLNKTTEEQAMTTRAYSKIDTPLSTVNLQ